MTNSSKIKVLLTGASGMVGKNLLENPAMADFDTLTPSSKLLNLCHFESVKTYLDYHKPDVIVHAAGKVGGIQANIREPVSFLVENLDMGRNIVLAARDAGIKRLVNLGSSCMYPRNHTDALEEDMVLSGTLEPTNEGYALAKIATARLCEYIMREEADFQYKTLIPCNIYGRHDKFDPAYSHLVPAIIHKTHEAKRHNSSIEIWGNGNARREFMYAGDLADALVHAIKDFDALPNTMNIGLGYDYSINEYYQEVADVIGYQGNFSHDLTKPVGMARKLVSINRQNRWGWRPKHSLSEGIQKTYDYYLKEWHQ